MAAPVTGEANLAEQRSDLHLIGSELKSPNSVEVDCIIGQLFKTSNTRPRVSFTSSSGKRRKSKPMRYEASRAAVQKEQTPSKLKIVVRDPLNPQLSFPKEKSPTKGVKTPLPSSPAMIRAEEFQSSLGIEFPSCIKIMVRSHVTSGFWMGLPNLFCKLFLPEEEATFVLEDENGGQCDVKYIAYKTGLSAGWKQFAVGHNLLEGDVLVFHLVESFKFKVYIIRGNDSKEVAGALSLLNLEAHTQQIPPVTPSPKTKKNKRPKSLPLTVFQKKQKKPSPSTSLPPSQPNTHSIEHSGNDSGSEVLEGSRPSNPDLSLQEVKTFQDFRIVVKGQCIDSELPESVRTTYYKLCLEKKEFLHDNLPEGLYYKLVAGMIGETVSIANEIKNCKITTTKEELEALDNSLKSFEILGMKVGFLRYKIRGIVTLLFELEGAVDMKKYMEAKNEMKRTENEIKKVEAKISELKESGRKFEGILVCLKKKVEKYEEKFKEEVNAPW